MTTIDNPADCGHDQNHDKDRSSDHEQGPIVSCASTGVLKPDDEAGHSSREESSLIERVNKRLEKGSGELSTIPVIAQRILAEFKDPDCSLKDLETLIMQDQVIAGKILRMANSSFYRGLQDMKNLTDAIMRLGIKEVQNIALTVAMKNMFKGGRGWQLDELKNLWNRSVVSAFTCREIAEVVRYSDKEGAYLAGLVHDIGKVFIIETLGMLAESDVRIKKMDQALFDELQGVMHESVGAELLKRWMFPDEIVEAVRYHHNPGRAPDCDKIIWIIAVSDFFIRKLGLGGLKAESELSLVGLPAMRALQLSDIAIAKLLVDLEEKSKEALEIL